MTWSRDPFYSSVNSKYLYITRKDVTNFLESKTTYQLTKAEPKPSNKPVYATYSNQRWGADLIDVKSYAGYNNNYKYILNIKFKKFYEYNKAFGRQYIKLIHLNKNIKKEYNFNTKHINFYKIKVQLPNNTNTDIDAEREEYEEQYYESDDDNSSDDNSSDDNNSNNDLDQDMNNEIPVQENIDQYMNIETSDQ